MAVRPIRQVPTRPSRREPPPWSGRVPAPTRRRRTALWRTLAAPVFALVVALIVAGAMAMWSGRGPQPAALELTAAETVRLRFLAEWSPTATSLSEVAAGASRTDFADRFASAPAATADPPSGPVTAYAPVPPRWPDGAPPEPGRGRPASTLLNEAQIASIKGRLKLTAEQEKLWPPVETALRAVVWRRGNDKRNSGTAALDTRSVEQLKAVAAPLMAKLRDDQKREIRTISHVMGIGDLAEQF
ncbi:MAG: hypothetical protein HXX10_05350 [Rhodoplanes sp.]|uniref:hypothetical protein n=1 Tax=Rhodoplanes sp. TaxID=1968906 RepID=UPI00184B229D|nr:hypothetical protein [Rhodoplanes sp.]NVO13445.1 hypothetical protein [Rhodoplanes sp.]